MKPSPFHEHFLEGGLTPGHHEGDLVVDRCLGLAREAANETGLAALLTMYG